MTLERLCIVRPSYDKSSAEPSKNYGIHCAEIDFFVRGPKGAITASFYTQWYVASARHKKQLDEYGQRPYLTYLSYHWHTQRDDSDYRCPTDCIYSPNGYSGEIGCNREAIGDQFAAEGTEFLYPWLETHYHTYAEKIYEREGWWKVKEQHGKLSMVQVVDGYMFWPGVFKPDEADKFSGEWLERISMD